MTAIRRTALNASRMLTAFALLAAVSVAHAGALDGRAFDVEMMPVGTDKVIDNTLTFHSGTFLSAVCVKHDFTQADYSATEKDGKVEFEATGTSYTKGHMDWHGTVEKGRLEATAVWHRPDRDEPIRFTIRGTEK